MMPFHPMVDGYLLAAAPAAALASGVAGDVVLVAGTTADEMRLFVDGSGEPPARDRLVRRTARYLGADEATAARVVDHYAAVLSTTDTREMWRAIIGDNEMQVPCRAVLDAHAAHGPTFTYEFTWEGPAVGSCHGIDIPFVFGNFVDGWDAFTGLDDDGRALSAAIRAAWGAVAHAGDPGWPPYPAARIFGRTQRDASAHPLLGRLAAARA
jgi:para-nitrobenzyl esterase